MAGIYLHIPFCRQACHYCDFHFSTNFSDREDVVGAIRKELEIRKDYLGNQPVDTIYLGGGTPSLLSAKDLDSIFNTIHQHYSVSAAPEITLEANPDDLTEKVLNEFRKISINRLSIGIQSFDDPVLKFLNRAHDAQAAQKCVSLAKNAGFKNISIDLIYSIPNQSEEAWLSNIEKAIALDVEHISAYSLTIEEKTAFGNWAAKGKLKLVEDDLSAKQLDELVRRLTSAGFDHYEVSNFGKPEFYSQHNTSYWKGIPYLGVGPSAHSYNIHSRQFNIANNQLYVKSLDDGIIPATIETLTPADKINDYLLTTLRTSWGTSLKKLKDEFGYDLMERHESYINTLISVQHARIDNEFLMLTPTGRLLADKISLDLFLD
jgi:oxygen-independent coproporphyrinogen III oxidase